MTEIQQGLNHQPRRACTVADRLRCMTEASAHAHRSANARGDAVLLVHRPSTCLRSPAESPTCRHHRRTPRTRDRALVRARIDGTGKQIQLTADGPNHEKPAVTFTNHADEPVAVSVAGSLCDAISRPPAAVNLQHRPRRQC